MADTQTPVTLESKTYWQLKALELEGQVLQSQMQQTLARFEARRQQAYKDAGLDASTVYALDDNAETFTPETPTTPPAPPAPVDEAPSPAMAQSAAPMRNRPRGVREMENLIETVRQVRAKYGPQMSHDECALLCNEVAWRHRASGWGLSRKTGGTRGRLPNGTEIAHDILHHAPSNELVDMLTAAGAESAPAWQPVGPPQSPDRTWVAPVDPASFGAAPVAPQPVAPAPAGPALADVLARVEAIAARLDLLAHNSTLTAEAVQRLEAAIMRDGLPLTLKAKLIGDVRGIVGGPRR